MSTGFSRVLRPRRSNEIHLVLLLGQGEWDRGCIEDLTVLRRDDDILYEYWVESADQAHRSEGFGKTVACEDGDLGGSEVGEKGLD
jgi:hypothetical protein